MRTMTYDKISFGVGNILALLLPRIRNCVVQMYKPFIEYHPILDTQAYHEAGLISHKRFVIEVKGIYAGLVMVEAKRIEGSRPRPDRHPISHSSFLTPSAK